MKFVNYLLHVFIISIYCTSILGPKRDKVTGERRKLHNEVLHNLYSPPKIVRMIKSRKMRWAGHVARLGRGRRVKGFGGET
jgi:hypothetical protein